MGMGQSRSVAKGRPQAHALCTVTPAAASLDTDTAILSPGLLAFNKGRWAAANFLLGTQCVTSAEPCSVDVAARCTNLAAELAAPVPLECTTVSPVTASGRTAEPSSALKRPFTGRKGSRRRFATLRTWRGSGMASVAVRKSFDFTSQNCGSLESDKQGWA